jgi:hypothetical protein
MPYLLIAAIVFILSSLAIYATTHNNYIGKDARMKGVVKAQYFRGIFAIGIFFTLIVMLVLKAFQS